MRYLRWFNLLCLVLIGLSFQVSASDSGTRNAEPSATTYEDIPFKQIDEVNSRTFLHVGAVLILVLAFGVLILWLMKKFIVEKSIGNFSDTRIKIVETKRLSTKLSVFLIRIDNQEYLLSQVGESTTMLRHEQLEPHCESSEGD